MSKNVYLIVTDFHFYYKNRRSRINYINEVEDALDKLINIGLDYVDKGYKVHLIFLGDIVETTYQSVFKAIDLNNIFVQLKSTFSGVYSVVGNHEMSKYKDNPFWSLFKTIRSTRMNSLLLKSWKPQGRLNLVEVVDILVDGDTCFYFNHHPTPVLRPDTKFKCNIGLFHKDIICKDIIEEMRVKRNLDVWDGHAVLFDEVNVLQDYHYAFNGHMHKVYGKWKYKNDRTDWETMLYYLASIGRPNVTEVADNFLERNIPAVIVEDGVFKRVEDNKFNLLDRVSSVKEEEVKKYKEIYTKRKEIKRLKNYIPETDNPVNNIKETLSDSTELFTMFESYISGDIPLKEKSLFVKLEEY